MSNGEALLVDSPLGGDAMVGVVIGLVKQTTDDPLKLGRVLLTFPTLNIASAWARVASFAAGPNKGAYFLPAEQDEVVVAFEQGDVSKPYVVGVLWNGQDASPVDASKIQDVRRIQTKSGSYLEFDDTDSAVKITISDKNSNTIVIDTQNNTISITSTGKINISAGDAMTISVTKKLTITAQEIEMAAQEGNLTVSSQGNTSVMSNAEISLNGTMINLN